MVDAWYVAKCHRVARAENEIMAQGFITFAPVMVEPGGRAEPMFPGYLFILFDVCQRLRWCRINNTPGVQHLLPLRAEEPTPVPGAPMDLLLKACRWPAGARCNAVAPFAPGDAVEALDGPFSGFVGRFQRFSQLDSWDRAEVLLALLGRNVVVELATNSLRPAA